MEVFIDVETSGFISKKLPADHPDQAWIMQLAFILSSEKIICTEFSTLIIAETRTCHPRAQAVHGISVEDCNIGGMPESGMLDTLLHGLYSAKIIIAHNIYFDLEFIIQYLKRNGHSNIDELKKTPLFCTMKSSTNLCRLPGRYGNYKKPKLAELYEFLFDEGFEGAHDALADVRALRRCYYRLMEVL